MGEMQTKAVGIDGAGLEKKDGSWTGKG